MAIQITREEYNKKFGAKPSAPDNRDALQKTGDVVNKIFPGKQVGQAIGTLAGAGIAKAKGNYDQYDTSAPNPLQVAGDVAKGAAMVGGVKIPFAQTILGKGAQFGALGAVSGAGEAAVQGGGTKEIIKGGAKEGAKSAALGVAFGVAEKGLTKLGQLLQNTGDKIQTSVIRPTATDIKDGFSMDTIHKYKLGGSLKHTFEKTDQTLDDLSRQLNEKLSAVTPQVVTTNMIPVPPPMGSLQQISEKAGGWEPGMKKVFDDALSHKDAAAIEQILPKVPPEYKALFSKNIQKALGKVDLNSVYENTAKRVLGNKLENFGSNAQMQGAIDRLQGEITSASQGSGFVSLPEAQLVKRASGHFGAWSFGVPTPEATANQKVYNTFYNELKTTIEEVSPEGVKELNQEMSKLIPVMNALIRRIPVAQRNNALSLTDIISLSAAVFDPRALSLTLLNLASKSGSVGALLSKTPNLGKILEKGELLVR